MALSTGLSYPNKPNMALGVCTFSPQHTKRIAAIKQLCSPQALVCRLSTAMAPTLYSLGSVGLPHLLLKTPQDPSRQFFS